jgi:hypothetical protein
MEIQVKIPKTSISKKKVSLKDESQFKKDIITFVNDLENKDFLNTILYDKFIKSGIEKTMLDQMIDRIKVFSSYDDDETNINFPYEDWIPKLLEYYTEKLT